MGELIQLDFSRKRVPIKVQMDYRAKILSMDRLELLEEMVRFQEKRTSLGYLTPEMMVNGQILFRAMSDAAETEQLRLLTNSYANHLKYECEQYFKGE